MKVKLKDVADRAGVSLTAASMILADKGTFPQETIDKVNKAAEELSYKRRNRKGHPPKVGEEEKKILNFGVALYLDHSESYLFSYLTPLLEQLENQIRKAGYNLMIIPILHSHTTDEIQEKILNAGVKGVFSIHFKNMELFDFLESKEIPVILILNTSLQSTLFSVCSDDFQGAYEGTQHLIHLGHKKIAYIDPPDAREQPLLSDRFIGFKKAMDENNLDVPDEYKTTISLSDRKIREKNLRTLMDMKDRPTALFTLDDETALFVIATLEKWGIHIPEDMSLIAPGDVLDYTRPRIPQITTMRVDTEMIGKLAADLMIDRITGHHKNLQVLKVKQILIERGSCRKISDYPV